MARPRIHCTHQGTSVMDRMKRHPCGLMALAAFSLALWGAGCGPPQADADPAAPDNESGGSVEECEGDPSPVDAAPSEEAGLGDELERGAEDPTSGAAHLQDASPPLPSDPPATLSPPKQYDPDGVQMLYASAPGSAFRLSTSNPNSNAQVSFDDGTPATARSTGKLKYWNVVSHKVTYASTGATGYTMRLNMYASGGKQNYTWRNTPGYISNPKDVRNQEVTAYARLNTIADPGHATITLKIRGGSHTSSAGKGDLASCTEMNLRPGGAQFSKEYTHPTYRTINLQNLSGERLKGDTWFGVKLVSYTDSTDARRVVNRLYVDANPFDFTTGKPRNNWNLLAEYIDVDGLGPAPYAKLANWGGWQTTLRVDGAKTVDIAFPSVREIQPPPRRTYSIQAGDFDGDGKLDLATLSQDAYGHWSDTAVLELADGTGFRSARWHANAPTHMRNGGADRRYATLVGDFNGDHRDDLAAVSQNADGSWSTWLAMELSNGNSFASQRWPALLPMHMRNGGSGATYWSYVGDFNGDGKADVLTLSPNAGGAWASNIELELSTGTGFTSTFWAAGTPGYIRSGGNARRYFILVGDFNGDGRSDLATYSPDGGGGWASWVAMELSNGDSFTSTRWSAATPAHMRNGGSQSRYYPMVGDFNGDGKADLVTVSPNAGGSWSDWAAVELSTGSGFTSTVWPTSTPGHMRNGGSSADYRVLARDFNGDGRADLVTLSINGGGGWAEWYAMDLSKGVGFESSSWSSPVPQHVRNGNAASDYRVLAGDFTGDGRADVAVLSPNARGAWLNWTRLDASTGTGFTPLVSDTVSAAAMHADSL